MGTLHSFEDLDCWKEARVMRIFISEALIPQLPSDEKFMLSNQIIRSSRAVCANIAEGFGRFHHQEKIQFCRMARGSLNETLNHVINALDENYIDDTVLKSFRVIYDKCSALINGYINYLKKAKNE
ncbi:MAG: four helix bundle protein [Flavobacteriaceae bacterium]|nr:four helix bundle protein [Flavobacteriaceae bacterium]MDZ4147314.1 four helix bundle protein [Flavobacteriaceae bacterium]